MPASSPAGKQFINDTLAVIARFGVIDPPAILDVGAGCGTYNWRYKHLLPGVSWQAIEVWEPYIEKYKLREKYSEVHVGDAREVVRRLLNTGEKYGLTIFGDVLEHMTQAEAKEMFDQARQMSKFILISIPIVHYPQGAFDGNPFEVHVEEDWSDERMKAVFGMPTLMHRENEIGVYFYRGSL